MPTSSTRARRDDTYNNVVESLNLSDFSTSKLVRISNFEENLREVRLNYIQTHLHFACQSYSIMIFCFRGAQIGSDSIDGMSAPLKMNIADKKAPRRI